MKDRIRVLMEHKHMQQNTFANFVGISPGTLSGIFNGRTKPTLPIVEAIKSKIPNLRVDWLVFGTGPMFEGENDDSSTAPSHPSEGQDGGRQTPEQQPSLFSTPEQFDRGGRVDFTPNNRQVENIKYLDKPQRKITEIRIFYDDQTWETFVPKK